MKRFCTDRTYRFNRKEAMPVHLFHNHCVIANLEERLNKYDNTLALKPLRHSAFCMIKIKMINKPNHSGANLIFVYRHEAISIADVYIYFLPFNHIIFESNKKLFCYSR